MISGSGRAPGEGNNNLLWYCCLENPMDRSLIGYSLWGCKESDTTERLLYRLGHQVFSPYFWLFLGLTPSGLLPRTILSALLVSPAFGLGLNLYCWVSEPPAYQLQSRGLVSFHNCMSQFLMVNWFICMMYKHIPYWLSFFREPGSIQWALQSSVR